MAFSTSDALWQEFLQAWPLERLRTMSLSDYTAAGDKETFTYWMESRLDEYGSIWGGSAFKFGIYSRNDTTEKDGDTSLAYDAQYGWYRKFGDTPHAAFEVVRGHVVAVAEAARAGRLEEIDKSPLGAAYRWKIAFHYQSQQAPLVACIYLRKPLLHFLQMPLSDTTTPQNALYRALADQRKPEEGVVAFSERVWKDWVYSNPLEIKLSDGAVKNGYLTVNLVSAPFPESMYGGATDAEAGDTARFVTDTGQAFDSDIRVTGAGGSGRLRKRLTGYFGSIGAKAGDIVRVRQEADGSYRIEAKANATPQPVAGAAVPAPMPQPAKLKKHNKMPLNQILYGPPGTGKTFETIAKALEVLDPAFLAENGDPDERPLLKQRFDELVKEGLIQFVTFHQSFSYEDFVEGVRAETDETTGQLRYEVADGVFKRLCDSARTRVIKETGESLDLTGRRIWKVSLGNYVTEGHIYEECIEKGIALIGFGGGADFSSCKSTEDIQRTFASVGEQLALDDYPIKAINMFVRQMKKRDLIVVTEGNLKFRAIGEIVGDYRRIDRDNGDTYVQCRDVRWLRVYAPALPYEALMENRFSQTTVYELRPGSINLDKLKALLKGRETGPERVKPRVLIIDEINRGNVSRIFGELITLIEPSKRANAPEALEAVLPYSKERFSVPDNVHLIGTMNTADRSLAGLDIALRRRFEFIEMPPRPELLSGVVVAGVDIQTLLATMNRRIEVLLDRDHMLGHAYFMSLQNGDDLASLATVFRNQVLPLLQEYFFEDWQRIAWVLNDHRKPAGCRFVVPPPYSAETLFGAGAEVPSEAKLWRLDPRAFDRPESYAGIIEAMQA